MDNSGELNVKKVLLGYNFIISSTICLFGFNEISVIAIDNGLVFSSISLNDNSYKLSDFSATFVRGFYLCISPH